jgi:hypothetical protein
MKLEDSFHNEIHQGRQIPVFEFRTFQTISSGGQADIALGGRCTDSFRDQLRCPIVTSGKTVGFLLFAAVRVRQCNYHLQKVASSFSV